MRANWSTSHERPAAAILFSLLALWSCSSDKLAAPYTASRATLAEQLAPAVVGPTLDGEFFTGSGGFSQTGNCLTDGTVALYFNASGIAAGPFPGTFSEHGRIIVSFVTDPTTGERLGTVSAFDAGFFISSLPDQVKGSKAGIISGGGVAGCDVRDPRGAVTFVNVIATSQYSVTIITASGNFPDQGETQVEITGTANSIALAETFGEGPSATPAHATNRDQPGRRQTLRDGDG